MRSVFSTKGAHPRDRFDLWHSIACAKIVSHTSRPDCRSADFQAEIETGSIGNLGLVLFENSAMHVIHSQAHIARVRSDDLFVCRQMSGATSIEQDTRQVHLQGGDLTLLDPLLPYEARFSSGSKTLVLKVSRRELTARVGNTREILARPIQPLSRGNGLTSSMAAMLPSLAGNISVATEEIVGNHALDLLAVSFAETLQGARPRVSSVRALLISNIRSVVESRLTDPDLDAQKVADAVSISVRYANEVLGEHLTSITRLIQARRLARCRQALEDPSQAHRTVSEIAYGWGFTDMTHFGRRFKKAYGILPSEYQAEAKGAILSRIIPRSC